MRNSIKTVLKCKKKKSTQTISNRRIKAKGLFSMPKEARRNRKEGEGEKKEKKKYFLGV